MEWNKTKRKEEKRKKKKRKEKDRNGNRAPLYLACTIYDKDAFWEMCSAGASDQAHIRVFIHSLIWHDPTRSYHRKLRPLPTGLMTAQSVTVLCMTGYFEVETSGCVMGCFAEADT